MFGFGLLERNSSTTPHSMVCTIPFRTVHGCHPAALVCFGMQITSVASVERQLLGRDEILELKHLAQSLLKMKAQVDNKCCEV